MIFLKEVNIVNIFHRKKFIFNSALGLSVRQHPTSGYFYPVGLRVAPVGSYNDIEHRIAQGTENRTIAATNMNATSSRAHTVVTIYFNQFIKTEYGDTKKTSAINLVDLAGKRFLL
jgi:hypothetical protein